MEITLTTPSLLFPAISLLMLAFTNRFLALASLIRTLYSDYKKNKDPKILKQIKNLKLRLKLIKSMQACGVISIFLCVLSMLLIFILMPQTANTVFMISLIFMMLSLALSFWEIQISIKALEVNLSDMEEDNLN